MMLNKFEPLLKKRLPILAWLPKYNKQDAISDLIAGVTVGLTLMPQAIAYAALAGLEPQYGLYSGCVGILMYVIFGSTKQITIGPTALLSLLTYNYTHDFGERHNADLVILFTFLVGVIELLCGIFQLGFLVNFVSTPVISGFTSAAAIIIASAQLKNLFGLKYNAETFIDIWSEFFKNISEIKLNDAILGFICIIILVILKKLNGINYKVKALSRSRVFLYQALWIITTGRNALVVVISAYMSYHFKHHLEMTPFTLTGNIYSGMPNLKLPPSSTVINGTEIGFSEMVSHLGSGLFVVPLIAVISNLALAKAFSNGGQVDATQEMIALGMCNIVGSFVQSMPVAGAFSRSAVNNSSGVRTTFGCIYTSILVLLTLSFLTPYFYYIPRASLAAVIVAAVLLMIDINIIIKPLWSVHKNDLLPGLVTFILSLFTGIEIGLVIGILVDILLILYQTAQPSVTVEKKYSRSGVGDAYWYVVIRRDVIMFPSVDHIRNIVFDKIILLGNTKTVSKEKNVHLKDAGIVIVDCLNVKKIDFTAAQGLNSLRIDLRRYDIQLFLLINENRDLVRSVTKLCVDMTVVSSIEELQSLFQKSKDNSKLKFVTDNQNEKQESSNSKIIDMNNHASVVNLTEVTKC